MYLDNGSAIDRLAMLLDDEALGRSLDEGEVISLARDVTRIVPELSSFMMRVIDRMKARQARIQAA